MYYLEEDKNSIYSLLASNPLLHVYSIGDLDLPFWKNSSYFIDVENQSYIHVYQTSLRTSLIAYAPKTTCIKALPKDLYEILPSQFIAQITDVFIPHFQKWFDLNFVGGYFKMGIKKGEQLPPSVKYPVTLLKMESQDLLEQFYALHYPNHSFEPYLLTIHPFVGIFENDKLICAGGIHVYSPTYRVAAVASIATDTNYRGRGLAQSLVYTLCQKLFENVQYVGLNVLENNLPAIKCYSKIGFYLVGDHKKFICNKKVPFSAN
ncbi:MAG: GNAT family N-acetyltransferase [Bacteroidia bacterium]|nr:GNAT family N-acetyltransferase [Bacteroidia bacterium]MDW8158134.1 GNAT family N-acetyltransferase [Bacteroidia bacterium]